MADSTADSAIDLEDGELATDSEEENAVETESVKSKSSIQSKQGQPPKRTKVEGRMTTLQT